MPTFGGSLMGLGGVVVLHAGLSVIHYKSLAKEAGVKLEADAVPMDGVLEALIGFALCLFGSILSAGKLKPIRNTDHVASKTLDMVNSRPEFEVFSHRGKALAQRRAAAAGSGDKKRS